MPENDTSEERAQIERAKRLRAHIERLKAGDEPPKGPKSIKEQLRERSRKQKRPESR